MNESDSGAEENISKSDENMQEKIPPSEDNSQSSSPPKRLSMKDFISMKCLGTGTFGEVVLAKAIADKRKYAIKILSKAHMEKVGWHYGKTNTQKNAISEREFLSMFKCRQVPTLYSCFQDGSSLYYVLEYCSGGTLKEYLDQCKKLTIIEIRKIMAELVIILEVMRSYGVCHRDLKLQNLVFDSEGHLKIIDFGSAKIFERTEKNDNRFDRIKKILMEYESKALMKQKIDIIEDDGEMDTSDTESKCLVGSAIYCAPESLINGYSDFETDYWALGIILYYMLFDKFPFDDDSDVQYNLFKKICAGQYEFPETVPPTDEDAVDLIKKLLTRDPKKRLGCGRLTENPDSVSANGFNKLKFHPFFKEIDYENLYKEKGMKIMKNLGTKKSASDSNMHTEGSSFSSSTCNLTVHSRKNIEILAKVDTKRKKFLLIEVNGHLILLSDNTIRYDQVYDNSSVSLE